MQLSSRRLKVEEKRLFGKFVKTIILLIVLFLAGIFIGLPLLVKIIVYFTSVRKDIPTQNNISEIRLLPPSLDPLMEATNSSPIVISGYSEKETKVKIIVNGQEAALLYTDKEGRFFSDKIKLKEGFNELTAIAIKKDQESTKSSSLNIEYKNSPPKLEIESPKEGEKRFADNRDLEISGQTDVENRVTVNDRMAIVDSVGKFKYRVRLSDGENSFKIKAQDNAGNSTEEERKVTFIP
jgi:hypothetical protein